MGESSERSDSAESHQVKDKFDMVDAFVYKLASRLGGRNEVVSLDFEEALSYLLIVLEEEERAHEQKQADLYMDYFLMLNANPAQSEKQADEQKQLLEMLQPESLRQPKQVATLEQMEQLKALHDQQYLN